MVKYLVIFTLLSVCITVSYGHPVAGRDSPSSFIETIGIDKIFKIVSCMQRGDFINAVRIFLGAIPNGPFIAMKEPLLQILNIIEPPFNDFFNIKDEFGTDPQHLQLVTLFKTVLKPLTGYAL